MALSLPTDSGSGSGINPSRIVSRSNFQKVTFASKSALGITDLTRDEFTVVISEGARTILLGDGTISVSFGSLITHDRLTFQSLTPGSYGLRCPYDLGYTPIPIILLLARVFIMHAEYSEAGKTGESIRPSQKKMACPATRHPHHRPRHRNHDSGNHNQPISVWR